jgi:hypothetical protein
MPDAKDDPGWQRPQRIPATQYTAKFLSDLQARRHVLSVDDSWTPGTEELPPGIRWVLYPNGDLLNVRVY